MNTSALPKVALIAGPTASGKSALALALAERHGGVVINADSAQVYADLRIVTARPSAADETRGPHLLFGYIDGADSCSAARWAADARQVIDDVVAAGRLPILVGGTGLYLRTLLDGIAPVPPIDPAIRSAVRAMPVARAYAALREADPDLAAMLHPTDAARIARGLETVRSTGRSITAWRQARVGGIGERIDLVAAILLPPRDWLNERIDRRFVAMAAQGALDEVAALLARDDVPAEAPIRRAIGVAELARALGGECSIADAVAVASLATRQYAKRQYTWFRNQPPADWRRIETTDPAEAIAAIEARLR